MSRDGVLFGSASGLTSLRALGAFETVARLRSLGRAAAALRISQPALTRAIAKLEREAGCVLFRRSAAGSALSESGAMLLHRTERFFLQLRGALADFLGTAAASRVTPILAKLSLSYAESLAAMGSAGSVAGAAAMLEMSAKNLRRNLRALEQVLGAELLADGRDDLVLTRGGAELARRLLLAGREIENGVAELAYSQGLDLGRTAVGCPTSACNMLLAQPLLEFSRLYPRTRVQMVDGDYASRLRLLRNGSIDLMIAHLEDEVPADLVQERLVEDRYVVVVRSGHPLTRLPALTSGDLARYDWVVPEQQGRREALERLFGAGGARPNVTLETYSRTMTRAMLVESDRMSVFSRSEVVSEEKLGVLAGLDYPGLGPAYTIALLTRRDWLPTRTQAALAGLIRAYARDLRMSGAARPRDRRISDALPSRGAAGIV